MEDLAVRGIVVHDQGMQIPQVSERLRRLLGALRLLSQGHLEPERAARARLALHPYLAAHELDELARDRKPQPRAAILARGGGVGLGEGLEEARLLLFSHADARVPDLEAYGYRVSPVPGERGPQDDLSLFGELHGVTYQVGEDLPEAPGVAPHGGRHVVLYQRGKLQPLLLGPLP